MAKNPHDEDRTSAVGLFNTARSYWRSAEHLNASGVDVTHPHFPVTFLFCHALELYLKAFLRGSGSDLEELRRLSHRVAEITDRAIAKGLEINPEPAETLSHIQDADVAIEARYIVTGFKSNPTIDALSSAAEHLDAIVSRVLQKLGFPIRIEEFARPEGAPPRKLVEDTKRVLVYLFQNDSEYDNRDVKIVAQRLNLEGGLLQYHLDRLETEGLADVSSLNYMTGSVYWGLTVEGRRYVVENRLA